MTAATPAPGPAPEPIAVLGMGCRFPGGADSPERFWELLVAGRDATGPLPGDRWHDYAQVGSDHAAVVQRATARGGFLADVAGFDSGAFGLSPREADLMDPQQRLLLEVSWEALERAGQPPLGLGGKDAGVFVGIGSDDYGRWLLEDLPRIEAWSAIGAALCAAANRVSHALDLRGPSIAVDTACSASLVAIHLACQSLRQGECSVALAAGVNLVLAPGQTVSLDLAGATAPDGRCKPFDAAADGYGRGEGCGVVVLRRWSDARRDNDPVLALVIGSAVHQDGRTGGIMAPSEDAQQQLLRRAYLAAGVDPRSVDYVEAHGTGTPTGDPLEAAALAAVLGAGRPLGQPCLVGSVKSNIGHLEAAAGVAGLIKAVLALGHGEIPATLSVGGPAPSIRWADGGLRLVTTPTPWPDHPHPRRVGVSGFGYGGTTAHVVLQQPPAPLPAGPTGPAGQAGPDDVVPALLFPLSSASAAGLRADAAQLADWLAGSGGSGGSAPPLVSLGHTLAHRRSHLPYRATVTASSHAELAAGLRLLADGDGAGATPVPAGGRPGGTVWVFSGHGAQWAGMGRGLLGEAAFAAAADELDPVFAAELGRSLRELLADDDLGRVDHVQPLIVAVQLGIAAVLDWHGARPDAVLGHSVGEISAAVAAGVLDRVAAAKLVCRRSRLLRRVAGRGAMAMVSLAYAEVERRLAGRSDLVPAIAASPSSTVVAGDAAAVAAAASSWRAEELLVREVATDVAFHSPHMDPLAAELAELASDLPISAPGRTLYSTALDDPRAEVPRDGGYWARNLRAPVRFQHAVAAAIEDGHRTYVEVSAHPVVVHSIAETLAHAGVDDAAAVPTLVRRRPELPALLDALGALHCRGIAVDWGRLQPQGALVALPGRRWQHRRHWRQSPPAGALGGGHDVRSHGLLGQPLELAGETDVVVWRTRLDERNRPYPGRHTVHGVHVVPAAVLAQTLVSAAAPAGSLVRLRDVVLHLPLVLDAPRELQVVRRGDSLRLASRRRPGVGDGAGADGSWLSHVTAERAEPGAVIQGAAGAEDLGSGDGSDHAPAVLERLASLGVGGTGFQWRLLDLCRGPEGLAVRVEAPPLPEQSGGTWAPLLDAALSVAVTALPGPPQLRLVAGMREACLGGSPPAAARVLVRATPPAPGQARVDTLDVCLAALDGTAIGFLGGVRFAPMEAAPADPGQLVHDVRWRPVEVAARPPALRNVIIVGAGRDAGGGTADALVAALGASGIRPGRAAPAELRSLLPGLATPAAVVVVPAPGVDGASAEPAAAGAERAAWLLTETAQQVVALGADGVRLWVLTEGVRAGRGRSSLAHAPLFGLFRVIAGEHPEVCGAAVDVPPGRSDHARVARAVLALLQGARDEPVIALTEQGEAEAPRLALLDRAVGGLAPACGPDGAYLITGGLGVLGLRVARWLADRGARRLALAARRALPPRETWAGPLDAETRRRVAGVQELESLGVAVRVVAVDVADSAAAARALGPDAPGLSPIRGVVHAAGVLDSRLLSDLDEPSLRAVLRPKVAGALVLHELFPPGTVEFLVLFSSCGQLLGMPGQASYAAANAFLDGLARHRHALGDTAALSLGWTSWRGQGMAVDAVVDSELRARGVGDLSPAEAFSCWERAASARLPYAAVLRVQPGVARSRRPPILREVADAVDGSTGLANAVDAGGAPLLAELGGLDDGGRRARLAEEVTRVAAAVLKLPAADVDARRPLVEFGMDSVMALLIRSRLEERLGMALPATLLWRRPTVAALTDDLTERVPPETDKKPQAVAVVPA
jgi:6-methylsalicylic acid synthase